MKLLKKQKLTNDQKNYINDVIRSSDWEQCVKRLFLRTIRKK